MCLTTWLYTSSSAVGAPQSYTVSPVSTYSNMMRKICGSPFRRHLAKLVYSREWKQSLQESHNDTLALRTYLDQFDAEIKAIETATDEMLCSFERKSNDHSIPKNSNDLIDVIQDDIKCSQPLYRVSWF
jgi:hypothetical protein